MKTPHGGDAFMTSLNKRALRRMFGMFRTYLPFLLIDVVVSTLKLMAMGIKLLYYWIRFRMGRCPSRIIDISPWTVEPPCSPAWYRKCYDRSDERERMKNRIKKSEGETYAKQWNLDDWLIDSCAGSIAVSPYQHGLGNCICRYFPGEATSEINEQTLSFVPK